MPALSQWTWYHVHLIIRYILLIFRFSARELLSKYSCMWCIWSESTHVDELILLVWFVTATNTQKWNQTMKHVAQKTLFKIQNIQTKNTLWLFYLHFYTNIRQFNSIDNMNWYKDQFDLKAIYHWNNGVNQTSKNKHYSWYFHRPSNLAVQW